ncbi:MAG: phage virion morphogenesis protein [Proteobacteria bacterium]|nr:phage virion morphogenesis protein [Pseudomonadota bacterium]
MTARKTGKWNEARRILRTAQTQFRRARMQATRQEALALKREIVLGLTSGKPGGRRLAPLESSTVATRRARRIRGTKPLLARGDLRRSISVVVTPTGDAFIGILRTATNRRGEKLVDVATVHEFGKTVVVPLTPASRRFLMATLRTAEIRPEQTGAGETGIVVVRIPARPFLRPAFKQFSRRAKDRFLRRIAGALTGDLGG